MTASRFDSDGFAIIDNIFAPAQCIELASCIEIGAGAGGTRTLLKQAWCRDLVMRLRGHPALSAIIAPDHVAVQCTYFEKSADRNWLVPLHQDLSIPVASRVDQPGLSGWSEKEGVLFVRAPADTLVRMVALRVHLDPCGADDGPLRAVPGSHRHGVLTDTRAHEMRAEFGEEVCLAVQGAVLAMRPLLLHASSKGSGSSRRRVLHVLFGPRQLPYGLDWDVAV